MAEDSSPGATPPAGSTPAQSPLAGDPQSPSVQPQAGDEPISLEAAKKLRQEAHALRERNKELEAKAKEAEDAKLSESERLAKRAADAERERDEILTRTQERVTRSEIRVAAQAAGIDPALAIRLVDASEVEFDSNGDPTNIDKLVAKLAKDYPQLAGKPASTGGGATNPSRSTQGAGEMTDAEYASLTPSQYEAQKARVQAYLAKKSRR